MFEKKSIFEKINTFLHKKGHEIVMSLYLDDYNGNQIYIRVDYVRKLSVYKIVWFDLNYIDLKHLDLYVNMQMMTKFMADRLINIMLNSKYESGYLEDPEILGDRVELLSYVTKDKYEFVFSRFLPLEWNFLIDPLVIIFSYLPRGMDCMLNEIVAKYDGVEEKYNLMKPIKFDLMNGDLTKIFKKSKVEYAEVLVKDDMVSYLEKVRGNYIAVVEGEEPSVVIVSEVKDDYVRILANCKKGKEELVKAATILAIRKEKFHNFYKVKLINENESLLDKVTNLTYFLCIGIVEDRLLIVGENGLLLEEPIVKDNKVRFEVIEDDDELSLSKLLEEYNK